MSTIARNSKFGEYVSFVSAWMLMSIVGVQFVYVNPSLRAIQEVYNETYKERYGIPLDNKTWLNLLTISVSAIVIGSFIGACISTFLVNNLSRKHVMQLCHILHLVGIVIVSLIGGLTKSYEAFIVGRVIMGIPAGVVFNIGPVVIAELCAHNRHEFWQSIPMSALNFGVVVGSVLGHPMVFGSSELWPIAGSLTVLPSMIYLISSAYIPNSPAYLINAGREAEALEALALLRKGPKENILNEFNEVVKKVKSANIVSFVELFRVKKYRKPLLLVFALFLNFMLCGVNSIGFYSDNIFIRIGLAPENVSFISLGVYVVGLFCALAGSFLLKHIGPNTMLMWTNICIILCITLFIISQALLHLAPTSMKYLTVTSVFLYIICWSGVSVAGMCIIALLTTESTRPGILGLGSVVFYFINWLTAFIIPYLWEGLGSYASIPWIVLTIILTIVLKVFLPITSGKTEEEIQAQMQGK